MPSNRTPATRQQAPTVNVPAKPADRPAGLDPDIAVAQADAAASNRARFADTIAKNLDGIGLSLPGRMDKDRFGRLLLTAANTNPDLFECDLRSFIAAGVGAAQLGLEPNDARGLAYLIPFWDSKSRTKKVQLIVGYKGMIDLARRSGMVGAIQAFPVFKGDLFEYEYGLEPKLKHIPAPRDAERWEDLEWAYAVAKLHLPNGNSDIQFALLSKRAIERAREVNAKAAASSYSPWQQYPIEMALKTAVRRLCKQLPQTVELANADATDERPLWIGDLGHGEASAMAEEPIDTTAAEVPAGVDQATGEITAGADAPTTLLEANATEEQPAS